MAAATSNQKEGRPVSVVPGCYILIIGVVLVVGTVVWGGYTFFRQAGEMEAFTDLEPAVLAVEAPDAAQVAELQGRLARFAEASGGPAELALTRDDLNALLSGFPRLADVKSMIRVREIGPDATFTADISFPMNALPGRRRYLNGELDGRFGAHPEAGLFVSVLDVRVPGRTVPPGFIDIYQRGIVPGKNFGFFDDMVLRNFREDPGFVGPLTRIASVTTEDDRIVVSTTKGASNPDREG